ncbi:CPBP family intramembrane glutamic endopeptidase [Halobacterium salinarum]|uniref:CPBP family intramembrane glutamic endopeptidase n=1 Tax=Halobacterium salinarum TaxID=2242 RepID=UPI001F1A6A77|nr:CPBP family intramembrane glutamic endopeptidase [Halobacterium salinarum]MCF2164386.1 CPBP family intramembrane metalloprotease [Halobacterium salinarum]MCF2167173.1 CPBP family intramembrane metalloprotease [Halobacterium salinarum]MCF2207194.1 CPBP family intramembrane metalloprotease [Halobacterium salinarum]MCF2238638.1 CPBP family intramembrane metalloprotease [Halobacterium salinarum]WJK63837.1 CPBP family intramembrane glutamic endopeptidase [Halobacterium salinarum]
MDWVVVLGGLALSFGGFEAVSRLQDRLGRPSDGLEPHVWKWLVPAAVAGYVLAVEGRPLSSIGWTVAGPLPFAYHTAVGLAAMLGSALLFSPLWEALGTADAMRDGMAAFTDRSVAERLVVAGTAGVTEEVPYRGYAVERVTALTGSPLLAAAVSLVAFLAAHVGEHWSRAAAVQMAQPTVVLLALYLWTHSLPVVMAVHALNDAVGLLLAGDTTARPRE